MFIFVLLVLGGFAVYVMSPEERRRLLRGVVPALRSFVDVGRQVHVQSSPFHDALRERTRLPIFTAAIVLMNVLMFFRMALRGRFHFRSRDAHRVGRQRRSEDDEW